MRRAFRYLLPGCALLALLAGCGKKEEQVVTLTPAVDPVVVSTPTPGASEESSAETTTESTSQESSAEALTEGAAEDTVTEAAAAEMTVEDLLAQDYMVSFANLTGQDIVKLQISFNTGDIQNLEVLGEKRLYDGEQFSYKNSMPESFRGTNRLKMTVTATAKDATVMLFPEIDILEPAHTDVVLTSSDDGWRIYLQ
ncbi:MAG: hypothetical protein J6N53_00355 [Lachnospiraceae bacterium]|nr:hypothetical protein [Lachnospiraceae bacterium]